MTLSNEIQALELDADENLILLYQVEWVPADPTTNTSAVYLNFHSYDTNDTLTFDSEDYYAMPIQIEGIEKQADGASARPTLIIPNVETIFRSNHPLRSQLASMSVSDFSLEELLNKRIIYRKTLLKYVKVGTTGTTPTNSFQFPKSEYVIDRIAAKTSISVQLELASPFELTNVKLPSRVVTGKYCPWAYKGWRLDKTDVKSACHWASNIRTHTGSTALVFFTIDDEPLIFQSCLPESISSTYNWSATITYPINSIVLQDNVYWQSLSADNLGNTPEEHSPFWRIVRTYIEWNAQQSGTVDASDSRRSSYVFKNGKVYKCVRNHGASKDPETNPAFWTTADVCGKLIASCKARYQLDVRTAFNIPIAADSSSPGQVVGIITHNGYSHLVPTAIFNNQISLPFGGFPGTKTFR